MYAFLSDFMRSPAFMQMEEPPFLMQKSTQIPPFVISSPLPWKPLSNIISSRDDKAGYRNTYFLASSGSTDSAGPNSSPDSSGLGITTTAPTVSSDITNST